MKTILVLGARRMQLPAILAAKDMGMKVITADSQPDAPGFAHADEFTVCDLADARQCVGFAKRHRIDAVMTLAADYSLPMVARICDELSLPGLTRAAADRATNKRLMRQMLADHGVPCPVSLHAATPQEATLAFTRINGPTIFKPTLSSGGRGVTQLSTNATPGQVAAAYDRAIGTTRGDGILVEEFLDGPEFSVEAFTFGGRTHMVAVTDKVTSGNPYWVETGHSQPSRWSGQDVETLMKTAHDSIAALGIDWAASHTEIRLGSGGPRVMEIAARLGGGYITSHLVPLSIGIDMVKGAIQLALGEEPALQSAFQRGAAIRFLSAHPGVLRAVSGVESALSVEGVHAVDVYVKPGDIILPLVDATTRIGHVITTAENAQDAIQQAEEARDRIAFLTELAPHFVRATA